MRDTVMRQTWQYRLVSQTGLPCLHEFPASRRHHLEESNKVSNNIKMTIKKKESDLLISFNWFKVQSNGGLFSPRLQFHKRREISYLPYMSHFSKTTLLSVHSFIHPFVLSVHSLSCHKSIVSSKASSPQRAIERFRFQFPVLSRFLGVTQ